jgi:two-component system chemotaxis response regulator CheB
MPRRDIVVIGASAGGLPPLTTIIEGLPADFQACVLVVVHTRAGTNGVLPSILSRVSSLPVTFATDGDMLRRGHVYVARPDFQLIVTPRAVRVLRGPRENGFRPAVDPLFRTAARAFGARVIGIVLSGALDDGTYGLSVIKQGGGTAIAQDPDEADISSMPLSAIRHVDVDYVLRAGNIAPLLVQLTSEEAAGGQAMAQRKELEPQLPAEATEVASMREMYGEPSALTCPECGGALWEIEDGRVVRYQCHTGHQFAPDSLQSEQRDGVDVALWNAVRVLEEHAELKMRMARRARDGGLTNVSAGFEEGARDAHQQAQQIRSVLFSGGAAGNGGVNGNESGEVPALVTEPKRGGRLKAKAATGRKAGRLRAAAKRRRG